VSTRVIDIIHAQYMLDISHRENRFSYLSKDANLGFGEDEVFQSDPFSLHVIEHLIYPPN